MKIISHRGYWRTASEKNTRIAFERSFELGFGTETDVRDLCGQLVISHDMPNGDEMSLSDLLDVLDGRDLPIALNIKADGVACELAAQLKARGVKNWFTFDMSIPEMVFQLRRRMPVFTRASEYERAPICLESALGIWLDAFDSEWYDMNIVESYLKQNKRVCVVSPELHGRCPTKLWADFRASDIWEHPSLMLCTDRPEEATVMFGGRK